MHEHGYQKTLNVSFKACFSEQKLMYVLYSIYIGLHNEWRKTSSVLMISYLIFVWYEWPISGTNSIQKIPWLHWLPNSIYHFSQHRHETMGKIAKQKLATTNSFRLFSGIFSLIPRLIYWKNTISRKLPVHTTSGIHVIYPKVKVRMTDKEEENMMSYLK